MFYYFNLDFCNIQKHLNLFNKFHLLKFRIPLENNLLFLLFSFLIIRIKEFIIHLIIFLLFLLSVIQFNLVY